MVNWAVVETIYVLDILIFGYLFFYFGRLLMHSQGESRTVMRAMTILTGVLFIQEIYFGVNTLTDPNKLAYASGAFPAINSLWLYAKALLTVAGATIIYTLMRLKK